MPKPARAVSFSLWTAVLLSASLPASDAFAYRMWIEADRDVETMVVGDRVSVSLHLDTEGQSDLTLLSIGTFFDSSILSYDASASTSTEFVLYAPGGGKSQPATWLEPVFEAPTTWSLNSNQVNTDFWGNTIFRTPPLGTVAISDDELLSIMVFEQTAVGDVGFLLATGAGNVLSDSVFNDRLAVNGAVDLGSPIGHVDTDWINYRLPDGCLYDPRDGGRKTCPADEDTDLDDDSTGDPTDYPTDDGGGHTGGGGGLTTTGDDSRPVAGVPEPSAALLFVVGLLAARERLRRRA